ncbi:hypothetical protein M885DRAFT_503888 [Pelagophyceae sp. CCMP2097]|nr:hypothetical protein M885DRAFT_503888 [Pelagophyceae sp. CCMP2097]
MRLQTLFLALAATVAALGRPAKVTKVDVRQMTDVEAIQRAGEICLLVRAFSTQRGGPGSAVKPPNFDGAENARRATEGLLKKKGGAGALLIAQRAAYPRDLVGFALLKDTNVLENVAVLVPERGRGVGESLLAAAEAFAVQRGAGKLVVEVEAFNGKGLRFFQAKGFVLNGQTRGDIRSLAKALPRRQKPWVVVPFFCAAVWATPGATDALRDALLGPHAPLG